MIHAQQPRPDNKFLGIEILRFASAVAILFFHYHHFEFVGDTPIKYVMNQQPFYAWCSVFYDYGLCAVQVFWCISGFIFFWKYREVVANKTISAKTFFILRFSRLYPLHIATLLIVLGLQIAYVAKAHYYFIYSYQDLRHFVLQLCMAGNWGLEKGLSFNGPTWSVSMEVLVYALFFLLLRVIGKSLWVNAGVIVFCGVLSLRHTSPILDCFAFFYMGGFSAVAFKAAETALSRRNYTVLAALLLALTAMIAYLLKWQAESFLLIFMPILLCIVAQEVHVGTRLQRIIEAAGNMTYASYLLHFPLQLLIAVGFAYAEIPIPYNNKGFFLLYMGATLLSSYGVYRCFEKPAQDYLRKTML